MTGEALIGGRMINDYVVQYFEDGEWCDFWWCLTLAGAQDYCDVQRDSEPDGVPWRVIKRVTSEEVVY